MQSQKFPEASQEHLGDQVMQKMVSPWKYSSLSPENCKFSVLFKDTRCNVTESKAQWSIQHGTYDHAFQCEISVQCTAL